MSKIFAAMNAVQSALSHIGIGKDQTNEQQRYKFRGIDDMYNTISGLLADNKVLPVPSYPKITREVREKKDGGSLFVTHVEGMFDFLSLEDGSKITAGPFPGEAMDTADKSSNKAMSAAFKYALMQVFTIPTEGDNDADATTHEVRAERPAKQILRPAAGSQSAEDDTRHYGNDKMHREPAAEKKPAEVHPLRKQLDEALDRYGVKRDTFALKTAEAMGVATIADIPLDQIPAALVKVIEHQKAAAKKKPALPPPDNKSAPDMQEPDDLGSDDDIPV